MNTSQITAATLSQSVIAVPPLARNSDLTLSKAQNSRIVAHLHAGHVRTLLYGGNANLYHVSLSEYPQLLAMLGEITPDDTHVIPSVGPAFGTMMDQAAILRNHEFATAMILPQRDMVTSSGIATAVRHFVEAYGRPAVLYIKFEGWIDVAQVRQLVDDDLISFIKYAIVRDDPADDDYLRSLTDQVDPALIVSGIGEQPAIVHLRDFGLQGFTSGCVCVAPGLSSRMLLVLKANDFAKAEAIRQLFQPLEDLRNNISPVRVLHAAVDLAGIAETGPILPLLDEVTSDQRIPIEQASQSLLKIEQDRT